MATTASLDVLKEQLSASQSYAIAWTCILVWDWLALLPQEARHFWTKKGFAPARIAFFANRYGTLVLQTVSLALTVSDIPNGELDFDMVFRARLYRSSFSPAAYSDRGVLEARVASNVRAGIRSRAL